MSKILLKPFEHAFQHKWKFELRCILIALNGTIYIDWIRSVGLSNNEA